MDTQNNDHDLTEAEVQRHVAAALASSSAADLSAVTAAALSGSPFALTTTGAMDASATTTAPTTTSISSPHTIPATSTFAMSPISSTTASILSSFSGSPRLPTELSNPTNLSSNAAQSTPSSSSVPHPNSNIASALATSSATTSTGFFPSTIPVSTATTTTTTNTTPAITPIPATHIAPSVVPYNPAAHAHLVLYLAALHGSCITHDGLTGTFATPLHHEKLLAWWKVRLQEATVLLLLLPPAPGRSPGSELVGAAMVHPSSSETSPHVAVLDLLLLSPRIRDKVPEGGQSLLTAVRDHCLVQGRTLLTTEAEADSDMAAVLLRLGFSEAGRIPDFVERPLTGLKAAQSILYKDLSVSL